MRACVIDKKRILEMMVCVVSLLFIVYSGFAQDTPVEVLAKVRQAYGAQLFDGSISDWVGQGKITITGYSKDEPLNLSVTIKGSDKVQRIISDSMREMNRCGSDGKKSWQVAGSISMQAAGITESLIESYTSRSISSLCDSRNKVRDLGTDEKDRRDNKQSNRILESTNDKQQITRYYVDQETSLVNRIEMDTGLTYRMPFGGKEYPLMISFVLSDYRAVDGTMRPFKVEVYRGLIRYEEMQYESIKHNTGIKDEIFIP
jgi:hypothetical protein